MLSSLSHNIKVSITAAHLVEDLKSSRQLKNTDLSQYVRRQTLLHGSFPKWKSAESLEWAAFPGSPGSTGSGPSVGSLLPWALRQLLGAAPRNSWQALNWATSRLTAVTAEKWPTQGFTLPAALAETISWTAFLVSVQYGLCSHSHSVLNVYLKSLFSG